MFFSNSFKTYHVRKSWQRLTHTIFSKISTSPAFKRTVFDKGRKLPMVRYSIMEAHCDKHFWVLHRNWASLRHGQMRLSDSDTWQLVDILITKHGFPVGKWDMCFFSSGRTWDVVSMLFSIFVAISWFLHYSFLIPLLFLCYCFAIASLLLRYCFVIPLLILEICVTVSFHDRVPNNGSSGNLGQRQRRILASKRFSCACRNFKGSKQIQVSCCDYTPHPDRSKFLVLVFCCFICCPITPPVPIATLSTQTQ